nr:hypothetical protein [Tanacetum cinerariifolium]
MPPRKSTRGNPPPPLTQDTVNYLIQESVEAAIWAKREGVQNEANPAEGPNIYPVARECTFVDFMKCSPITFRGNEGAVGLIRWIEKTVFAAATFQDRALTWWNSQVATSGMEVVTRKTVKEMDISSYTTRFNELVILCPVMVPTERKKIEAYIRGLSKNIKGKVTSSEPATLSKAMRMAHTLMEQKVKAKAEREADNKKRKCGMQHYGNCSIKCNKCGKIEHKARDCWSKVVATGENAQPVVTCYRCGEKGHIKTNCPARNNPGRNEARGQAYALRDGDQNLGPNVVTDTFLLNNRYARVLFDSGVVSTNTILRGYALNLVNHLFEIDLMPIKLGTFDVIIGMDWLMLHDTVIVRGKKEVHVPLKKRTLLVKGLGKGFSPHWIGNNIPNNQNGWTEEDAEEEEEDLEEDPKEDPEEEPEDDDDDIEIDDEAELIDPYMDDGSNNPPPPNSKDEETLPTSPVIPDVDGQPIPPIASDGLEKVRKDGKFMSERIDTEGRIKKKFKEQDHHFLGLGCDNIEMDRTVRKVMSDLSGLKKLVKGLSDRFDEYERSKLFDAKRVLEKELVNERNGKEFYREFDEYMCRMLQNRRKSEGSFPLPLGSQVREPLAESSTRPVPAPYPNDPYVVTRDATIADAAIATFGINDDDDDTAPMDSQPYEPPAIRAERERVQNEANRAEGPNVAPVAKECTFANFMKCSPITFRRNEGAVGLIRWIENTEMVFTVSKCTETNKVVFAAATF